MNVIPFHPIPLYKSYSHDNTLQDYIRNQGRVSVKQDTNNGKYQVFLMCRQQKLITLKLIPVSSLPVDHNRLPPKVTGAYGKHQFIVT